MSKKRSVQCLTFLAGLGLGLSMATPMVAAQSGAALKEPAPLVKEIITSRCATCHGFEGLSASAIYPRLAAQHPDYIIKQLHDFRSGRRKSDVMNEMAKDLKDEQIPALAAWFSSRPAANKRSGDPELVAVGKYIYLRGNPYSGVAACTTCHGENGHGTQQLPRIATQHPAYLLNQLKDFGKRERTNDNAIMHSIASRLTELEMNAVAAYLGSVQ